MYQSILIWRLADNKEMKNKWKSFVTKCGYSFSLCAETRLMIFISNAFVTWYKAKKLLNVIKILQICK